MHFLSSKSFNRTIVELKLAIDRGVTSIVANSFNRTIVELKPLNVSWAFPA